MATAVPHQKPKQFFTFPFRKRRKRYIINPPDDTHQVIYLGNVLTVIAKGEECVEKPLALIWRTHCSKRRSELRMKLTVTRSGLKVETKQQGITEYWAHRITYCIAPCNYPRVFCWVYKHEGKRLKPELRCHAALCKNSGDPYAITLLLKSKLQAALQEYRREKIFLQNTRLNAHPVGQYPTPPRRKLLLQTGSLNFRPPVSRSRSAPRLFAINEEDEVISDETQDESLSDDEGLLCYHGRFSSDIGSVDENNSRRDDDNDDIDGNNHDNDDGDSDRDLGGNDEDDDDDDDGCSSHSLGSSTLSDSLSSMPCHRRRSECHCKSSGRAGHCSDDTSSAGDCSSDPSLSISSDDLLVWDEMSKSIVTLINRGETIDTVSDKIDRRATSIEQLVRRLLRSCDLRWQSKETDKDTVSEESGYHDICGSDEEGASRNDSEIDESQYDEQVTAL